MTVRVCNSYALKDTPPPPRPPPCALFPYGPFHQLLIHPSSDVSGQKGIKGTSLINSLLLSIISEDFTSFLINLLFIYLKIVSL